MDGWCEDRLSHYISLRKHNSNKPPAGHGIADKLCVQLALEGAFFFFLLT